MKYLRNIYAFIGIVFIIIIATVTYFISQKSTDKQVGMEGVLISSNSQKKSVETGKLQEAKTAFPSGFPLPNDTDVTAVGITQRKVVDNITWPGKTFIDYTSQEDTSEILKIYSSAMKLEGLNPGSITSDPSNSGEESIYSSKITVTVINMPNGSKTVNLSINN